jgi:tetratricopeptide (TPR) repeat protein
MRPARTVLEQKIRERRLTLEEFAAFVETFAREHNEPGTVSVRHLQRLVSGRGPKGQPLGHLSVHTTRLLEQIFGIPIGDLIAPPATTSTKEEDTAREFRQFLYTSSRVDGPMVELFRNQLMDIRIVDRQLGTIIAGQEVRAKLAQVELLLTHSMNSGIREQLAALAADLHTLAGWQALDIGRIADSWQHYEHAKSAARESGILPFEIYASGEQTSVLLEAGEVVPAIELLDHLLPIAQKTCPPLLYAWLTAARGEALAKGGRSDESRRSFDAASEILEENPADSGGPYIKLDAIQLDRWRGHSLTQFAHHDAIDLLTSSLDRLDPTFARAEVSLRADLASALASVNLTQEAAVNARQALTMARQIGSVKNQRKLEILMSRLGIDTNHLT